jgi:hypothetical protein
MKGSLPMKRMSSMAGARAGLLSLMLALASCGSTTSQYVPLPASAPDGLNYPDPNLFTQGVTITPLVPTLSQGIPTNYMVVPDLPAGLKLNADGSISGTPSEPRATDTYLVTAGNSTGTSSFGVRITVIGRFTIGGVVTGLTGTGLVLTNNDTDNLAITANGSFVFEQRLGAGGRYRVTVATQPTGQTCSVSGGTGTLGNDNFGRIAVACSANPSKSTIAAWALRHGIQALVLDDARTLLYAACSAAPVNGAIPLYVADSRTGLTTLLTHLEFAPTASEPALDQDAGTSHVLQASCGPTLATVDAQGQWARLVDSDSGAAAVYLPR